MQHAPIFSERQIVDPLPSYFALLHSTRAARSSAHSCVVLHCANQPFCYSIGWCSAIESGWADARTGRD